MTKKLLIVLYSDFVFGYIFFLFSVYKNEKDMGTNIEICEEIMQNVLAISGLKTKKAFVNLASKEFLKKQAKLQILKLQGELVWEGDLDKWRVQ